LASAGSAFARRSATARPRNEGSRSFKPLCVLRSQRQKLNPKDFASALRRREAQWRASSRRSRIAKPTRLAAPSSQISNSLFLLANEALRSWKIILGRFGNWRGVSSASSLRRTWPLSGSPSSVRDGLHRVRHGWRRRAAEFARWAKRSVPTSEPAARSSAWARRYAPLPTQLAEVPLLTAATSAATTGRASVARGRRGGTAPARG
jgi:hypothetical protein